MVTPDLMRKRFGRWTVIWPAPSDERRRRCWVCRCDCGTVAIVPGSYLISGGSQACRHKHADPAGEVTVLPGGDHALRQRAQALWRALEVEQAA